MLASYAAGREYREIGNGDDAAKARRRGENRHCVILPELILCQRARRHFRRDEKAAWRYEACEPTTKNKRGVARVSMRGDGGGWPPCLVPRRASSYGCGPSASAHRFGGKIGEVAKFGAHHHRGAIIALTCLAHASA